MEKNNIVTLQWMTLCIVAVLSLIITTAEFPWPTLFVGLWGSFLCCNICFFRQENVLPLQANISITPLTRSRQDIQKGLFWNVTNTHTDGHGDYMTEWARELIQ